jgi:hypothetical protein
MATAVTRLCRLRSFWMRRAIGCGTSKFGGEPAHPRRGPAHRDQNIAKLPELFGEGLRPLVRLAPGRYLACSIMGNVRS